MGRRKAMLGRYWDLEGSCCHLQVLCPTITSWTSNLWIVVETETVNKAFGDKEMGLTAGKGYTFNSKDYIKDWDFWIIFQVCTFLCMLCYRSALAHALL